MSMPLSPGYTLLSRDGRAQHTWKKGGADGRFDPRQRASGPIVAGVAEGLQIVHETDGTSRLFGSLQDQPALYGVLTKIGRLNLTLLSLESSELTHKE